ncbi:helix-turn-helix domain-containing protein [Clostridium sp. UBA1056]|uniref:helix-turn-helix domain-containing protein n=2 Tax=unclassified Clostridium TaxID=2614128 RepID=UPI0039C85FEF
MDMKQLRKLSGLKTSKVCEELGISRTQLYNLENKVCKMDKLKIEKLSFLYRVTKEEIIKALEVC